MSTVSEVIFKSLAAFVFSGVVHAPAIFNGKWWHGLLGVLLFVTFGYGLLATLLALPTFAVSWLASTITIFILGMLYGPFVLYGARLHFGDMAKGFSRIVMSIALAIFTAFTILMFITLGFNFVLVPLWVAISAYVALGLAWILLIVYVVLMFIYPYKNEKLKV